jgi:hypothetical protein
MQSEEFFDQLINYKFLRKTRSVESIVSYSDYRASMTDKGMGMEH